MLFTSGIVVPDIIELSEVVSISRFRLVLSNDIAHLRSRNTYFYKFPIALQFHWCFGSSEAPFDGVIHCMRITCLFQLYHNIKGQVPFWHILILCVYILDIVYQWNRHTVPCFCVCVVIGWFRIGFTWSTYFAMLTHWALGDLNEIWDRWFSS